MKKIKYVLALFVGLIMVMPVMAYTIDGDLNDWCLDLTQNWSKESTWVPGTSCSAVQYIVEDNIDPDKWAYGNPQYATGVHIRGPPKSKYDEPLLYYAPAGVWIAQPYGGEGWDIEAIYLDNDSDYVYIAVVTSTSPGGLGDLGIDMDGDGVYEYGVKLNGVATGVHTLELYSGLTASDWAPSIYFPNIPMKFSGGTKINDVEGAFVENTAIGDHGFSTYIIEIKILKDDLGGVPQMLNLHLTPICGNDPIPAPELVMAVLTVALVSPAFIYLFIKRRH